MSAILQPIEYREATLEDVDSIAQVESDTKRESNLAPPEECDKQHFKERWNGYIRRVRHPQYAEEPRILFVATALEKIVGFVAGHFSRRYETEGELQSIHILKSFQNQGIGFELLRRLAEWFVVHNRRVICVGIDPKNPYQRFYEKHNARRLNPHWFVWDDIGGILAAA